MKPDVHIALTMDDGSFATVAFKVEGRSPTLPSGATWLPSGSWHRPATSENIDAELAKTFPGFNTFGIKRAKPVSWRIINPVELPGDRTYRNSWEDKAGVIVHNLEKARNIHRDRIREARASKLVALDLEYQRADEANDPQAKKQVVERKQFLRDLPAHPAIDAAQTITQLKAFWPPELD